MHQTQTLTVAVKIRGIYATALTRFFLDHGALIVSPSRAIEERFGMAVVPGRDESADLVINSMDNDQGVDLEGRVEAVDWATEKMREAFRDGVVRERSVPGDDRCARQIEFFAQTKADLDALRRRVIPTVRMHHQLRLVSPDFLDLVEPRALSCPEELDRLGRSLEKRLIWDAYETGAELAIEHVKIDGRVLHLSPGEILECDPEKKRLVLKRSRFSGRHRYDGLGSSKAEGDYAVSEAVSGNWFYRHTYFRRDGEWIGTYCNINTPIECYPDRMRYLDLEVDVVLWPEGKVAVIDREELESHYIAGFIGAGLRNRAMEVAGSLAERLKGTGGNAY